MRTGSSVRSSFSSLPEPSVISPRRPISAIAVVVAVVLLGLFFLDDVDTHLREHRHHVLDLLGRDLIGRQNLVELVVGDETLFAGRCDHPLHGGL